MIRKAISAVYLIIILSSCSATILSVGKEEYSILYHGVNQNKVSSFLGAPIESTNLEPPITFPEIKKQYDHIEFLGYPIADKKAKEIPASKVETYKYDGRIQRKYDIGEAIHMAGYTIFLSELIMVPKAIQMQFDRSNQIHFIKVWYSKNNIALAYQWKAKSRILESN